MTETEEKRQSWFKTLREVWRRETKIFRWLRQASLKRWREYEGVGPEVIREQHLEGTARTKVLRGEHVSRVQVYQHPKGFVKRVGPRAVWEAGDKAWGGRSPVQLVL